MSETTTRQEVKPKRVVRLDYRTLVAAIGVILAVLLLVVFLDAGDARREAAREAIAKDAQIERRDRALGDAASQSARNGEQIDKLVAQVAAQNALTEQQNQVVSALRNELAKRGISTVIENGKVRIIPGPVQATNATVRASGSGAAPTGGGAAPSRGGVAPGATVSAGGSVASPTGGAPAPSPTAPRPNPTGVKTTVRLPGVTSTRAPTVTAQPTPGATVVLPSPLPSVTVPLPLPSVTLTSSPTCIILVCVTGKSEGTP